MIEFLEDGILLQQPAGCPDDVYRVMLGCWRHDPRERFAFHRIHRHLRELADDGHAAGTTEHDDRHPADPGPPPPPPAPGRHHGLDGRDADQLVGTAGHDDGHPADLGPPPPPLPPPQPAPNLHHPNNDSAQQQQQQQQQHWLDCSGTLHARLEIVDAAIALSDSS